MTATTVKDVRKAFQALTMTDVQAHFDAHGDDPPAIVVCDGVSVDVFNEYFKDDECLPIPLRFVELTDDGQILIIDYPSGVHETISCEFLSKFLFASGNPDAIGKHGSTTAQRPGHPNKQADKTFGPLGDTPNRTPPPPNIALIEWFTLVVEVGRYQPWTSLENAARWWHGYPGIQYVLLLKVSKKARSMAFRLYDVVAHPIGRNGRLPTPVAASELRYRRHNGPAEQVAFDARRLLSIPAGQALPAGMNDPIIVDLRMVMNQTVRALGT